MSDRIINTNLIHTGDIILGLTPTDKDQLIRETSYSKTYKSPSGFVFEVIDEDKAPGVTIQRPKTPWKAAQLQRKKNKNWRDYADMSADMNTFDAVTGGVLNRLIPSQDIGLIVDMGQYLNGNAPLEEVIQSHVFGNTGVVTDNYAYEHPYWSAIANAAFDVISPFGGKGTYNFIRNRGYNIPRSYSRAKKFKVDPKAPTANFPSGKASRYKYSNGSYMDVYHPVIAGKIDKNVVLRTPEFTGIPNSYELHLSSGGQPTREGLALVAPFIRRLPRGARVGSDPTASSLAIRIADNGLWSEVKRSFKAPLGMEGAPMTFDSYSEAFRSKKTGNALSDTHYTDIVLGIQSTHPELTAELTSYLNSGNIQKINEWLLSIGVPHKAIIGLDGKIKLPYYIQYKK